LAYYYFLDMSQHRLSRAAIIGVASALALGYAVPASAFYLEVPQVLKELAARFRPAATVNADENETVGPGPGPEMPPPPVSPAAGTPAQDQPQPSPYRAEMPPAMPLDESRTPNQPPRREFMGEGEFRGERGERREGLPDEGRREENGETRRGPEMPPEGEFRDDFRRGVKEMDRQMNEVEFMIRNGERSGQPVPKEMRERYERGEQMMDNLREGRGPEDMRDFNMDEFGETVDELEQDRRRLEEEKRRLSQLQREVKNIERGLANFEKQAARLQRQKLAVPAGLSEQMVKIKEVLAAVKAAKTWEEAEAAGVEDMHDLMQSLDEWRQELEMLARWPQTAKQIDRELSKLAQAVKKAKTLAARLAKKEIDISAQLAALEDGYNRLKDVRAQAGAHVAAGNSQAAFDLLESDFFGQTDDIYENQRLIEMMGNLGRFNSDFTRGVKKIEKTITKLKRQKVDTADMERMLSDMKSSGAALLSMIKNKDFDPDEVLSSLMDLENLKQELDEAIGAATGEEEELPWQKGKDQFSAPRLSSEFQRIVPRRERTDEPPADFGPPSKPLDEASEAQG